MKVAFMFPGQGAQTVGMGKDIYENYEEARQIYDKASQILQKDIKKLCFEEDIETLSKTENTQIAILTTSLAILEVMKNKVEPEICVGLSLGEYTALTHAGFMSLETVIPLVAKRGYYMGNYIPKEEYLMAAVIGMEEKKIEEICEKLQQEGKFVVPANYNCSVQTAISGTKQAIQEAMELLKQAGAKRVLELKTSGPFHTEKLKQAQEMFQKDLEKAEIKYKEGIKVIKNLDGKFYCQEDKISQILAQHITHPVQFTKSMKLMEKQRIDTFIEIGPGKVLTGFVKKEIPQANTYNINNIDTLSEFLNEIQKKD